MPNILVTGGAGFVGSYLCQLLLDRGHNVYCLDNLSTGHLHRIAGFLAHDRFFFIEADCKEITSTFEPLKNTQFAEIYHLAGLAQHQSLEKNAELSVGTYQMLAFARYHKAPLMQVIGMGEGANNHLEKVCRDFCTEFPMDVRLARMGTTYGATAHHSQPNIVNDNMLKSLGLSVAQPSTLKSDTVCYISDAVTALEMFMHVEKNYIAPEGGGLPSFNIVGTECVTEEQIKALIAGTSSELVPKQQSKVSDIGSNEIVTLLAWQPVVDLVDGLESTKECFQAVQSPFFEQSLAHAISEAKGPQQPQHYFKPSITPEPLAVPIVTFQHQLPKTSPEKVGKPQERKKQKLSP